jgi:hypothetical protein
VSWQDDSWRDSYDEWKLRSPYDNEPEDECFHDDYEIDWQGLATCEQCGHMWTAAESQIIAQRLANEAYDEHCCREERRERFERWFGWLAFRRRWKRKPAPIDEELPF